MSDTRARIQRTGRRLRLLTIAAILATPGAVVLAVLARGPLALVSVPAQIAVAPEPLAGPRALFVVGVGLLTPATYLVALAFLYRLFGLYEQGVVFAERNVTLIRRTGFALMAVDVVRALQSALAGVVLRAIGATSSHLSVELGVGTLIIGAFVVSISRIMDLGRDLDESDRLTI